MRVIVVGAGEVGSNVAAGLADSHDVVVVDIDADKIEAITYSQDVLAIEGSGTSLATLHEAGIEQTDMLIASADQDETNLAVCGTAEVLGDPFTIARVKSTDFLDPWRTHPGAYGVDYMVCTDLLTAEDIVRVIGLPAATDAESFANGLIHMAEFPVSATSELANQTVEDADRFEEITFAGLVRADEHETTVARGDLVIEPGDKLIVIGTQRGISEFVSVVDPETVATTPRQVLIVGGSRVGYHTARLLEDSEPRIRLIEQDPDRARHLAEELTSTTVFEHDATDVEFLRGEQIEEVDVVVTALDTDERNLLMAILAKQLGVDRTVAVVETGAYAGIFEAVGIDVAVNPREIIAEEIIRLAQAGQTEKISLIEDEGSQVMEIEIDPESPIAGQRVRDAVETLPEPVVFGAITREGEIIMPRGATTIEPGDHVVLFVADNVEAVTAEL